jgi:hypothetical protein
LRPPSPRLQELLGLFSGGLKIELRPAGKGMMKKLLTIESSVIRRSILGFIAASLLCGCVTTRPYDIGEVPNQDSITDYIMRWDKLDRTKANPDEYRELFGQSLKTISRLVEENEKLRKRLDQQ